MNDIEPIGVPYFSPSKSTINYLRLCRLITTICSDLLRDVLSRHITPANLRSKLDSNRKKLEKIMNVQQKEQIFKTTGNPMITAKDLDISLLYLLLRNICNIPKHKNGWGERPRNGDNSIAACIERIRIHRNLISAHSTNGRVEEIEFKEHWSELQDAVIKIEKDLIGGDLYERGVKFLYSCSIDVPFAQDYKRDLKKIQGPPNVVTGCETSFETGAVVLIAKVFPYDNLFGIIEAFWTKNGEQLDTQDCNGKYNEIRLDNPSLTIHNVNLQDSGSYQFTATNSMGTTISDIIVLDVPKISLQNPQIKEDGSQWFKVTIESTPAPLSAQWKVKSTNDGVFELLDMNAEEYRGTLISLPQPVLVVKQKECLETHFFQIEVNNFIGSSTKIIPTDVQPDTLVSDSILNVNMDMFYNNGGASVKFSNLFDEIAENIPEEKVDRLKDIIQNSCKLKDIVALRRAISARDCIRILKDAKLFTPSDVIFIQYVLKKIDCGKLYAQCYRYAETQKALCFYEKHTENGYKNVQFHVRGNLSEYSTKQIEKIKETVAVILGCSTEEIIVIGYCPSKSFLVVLSIKDIFLSKLLEMEESEKCELSKLNIDYLIFDLLIIYIEPSTGEQEWNIYFDQSLPGRSSAEEKDSTEATSVLPKRIQHEWDQTVDSLIYRDQVFTRHCRFHELSMRNVQFYHHGTSDYDNISQISTESRDSGSCSVASAASSWGHTAPSFLCHQLKRTVSLDDLHTTEPASTEEEKYWAKEEAEAASTEEEKYGAKEEEYFKKIQAMYDAREEAFFLRLDSLHAVREEEYFKKLQAMHDSREEDFYLRLHSIHAAREEEYFKKLNLIHAAREEEYFKKLQAMHDTREEEHFKRLQDMFIAREEHFRRFQGFYASEEDLI